MVSVMKWLGMCKNELVIVDIGGIYAEDYVE